MERTSEKIAATMKADPFGAKEIAPGELHQIDNKDLQASLGPDVDLAARAHAMLKLFHNMRAALHVPDQPPDKVPPASGPGRNDAFGLLSASLLKMPQPSSPIKFGLVGMSISARGCTGMGTRDHRLRAIFSLPWDWARRCTANMATWNSRR